MIIAALNETDNETRVAITPSSVKHFINLGFKPHIEQGAGLKAGFKDHDYEQVGATIINNRMTLLQNTGILLCVGEPDQKDIVHLTTGSLIIGHFDKDKENAVVRGCLNKNLSLLSMNFIPRISRAQSMDSLSSQANLAGYRAILEAICHFKRAIPMMMTAAGMIHPAKILIIGAGVAGLQAIATAKRLGAVVYAFDVRKAAKEQVESLGAEFIEVSTDENMETSGGYASETSEEYKKQQAALINEYARKVDIIITTALIPGKKAPLLLNKQTAEEMKAGSVIVDLATSRGGNCEVSVQDKIIQYNEITIIGISNMAGLVPATASELYANNLLQLIKMLSSSPGEIHFDSEDEIIQQALICHKAQFMPFQLVMENEK